MKTLKQTGFTLVEIAIVLVVIGLLLGGILKGQQLINSARVRNMADQNSGVQAAYYGFIDRFRNIPGDMTAASACKAIGVNVDPTGCAAGTSTIGGDGNGRIETVQEAAAVWAQLSVAGFISGTYTGDVTTGADYRDTAVSKGQVPPNAFQGPIFIGHMNDYIDGNTQASVKRLGYSFGGNIPVPLLRDLDQKLDDGIAGKGVLRSASGVAGLSTATDFARIISYDTSVGSDCLNSDNPATWNVDSSNTTCNAVFLY